MKRWYNWLKKLFKKSRCFPLADLFVISGYSAKTSTNSSGQAGGWIEDLARDNFTIVGPYFPPQDSDWLDEWMDEQIADCITSNICLAYTIVPRRTVTDIESFKYHGPVGSPIRVANVNSHGDDEVADATDEQMDVWIADIERQIESAVTDSAKNKRIAL
jgi:hypothetical protein